MSYPVHRRTLDRLFARPGPKPSWIWAAAALRKSQTERYRRPGIPFNIGQKQIFLPRFTVTLLRSPFLGPKYAQFEVPLNFNKFDLRDYLFHAYSVKILSVRSVVIQQKILRKTEDDYRMLPGKRMSYRPRAIKRMTVELEKPFVWPEMSENLTNWENKKYNTLMDRGNERALGKDEIRENKTKVLEAEAEDADKLLKGLMQWKIDDKKTMTTNDRPAKVALGIGS